MIVCVGSGGVGKTTVAAAIAVRAAILGRRVLVLTVDPAMRLATSLRLDLQERRERTVKLSGASGVLSAAVIDSKQIFDEFIFLHARPKETAERIMKNRLYQQLSTTLSGSQEFTALERLMQAHESNNYDLVVLDTPPTQHAMDFLSAPKRISALFHDSITKWFFPTEAPKGIFASLLGRSTRLVLKSLETLTGAQFIEELIDFFTAVRAIQAVLRSRSESAQKLLTSEKTSFIVVSSFDAAKLQEAQHLRGLLHNLGYHLRAVVINRAFPDWLPEGVLPPSGVEQKKFSQVLDFFTRFQKTYAFRYNLYNQFARSLGALPVIRVPEYQQDVYGIDDLIRLSAKLSETK